MICVEMEMADLCILNDENCVVVANQLHRITLSLSAVGTRKRKECCVACDVLIALWSVGYCHPLCRQNVSF